MNLLDAYFPNRPPSEPEKDIKIKLDSDRNSSDHISIRAQEADDGIIYWVRQMTLRLYQHIGVLANSIYHEVLGQIGAQEPFRLPGCPRPCA